MDKVKSVMGSFKRRKIGEVCASCVRELEMMFCKEVGGGLGRGRGRRGATEDLQIKLFLNHIHR